MKTRILSYFLMGTLFLFLMDSCRSTSVATYPKATNRPLPPGQAKKMYGHQSARAFAPGQQKQHGKNKSFQKKGPGKHKGKRR